MISGEFMKRFRKLFLETSVVLSAETEDTLCCRSFGSHCLSAWQWTYRRTRTQQLLPGTPRLGQPDQWRILQTVLPQMRLPGKEIMLSVNRRSSGGNPVMLLFIFAFIWAITDGQLGQFCCFVAVPASETFELQICSLPVSIFHQRGCRAEKLKANLLAVPAGFQWDLVGVDGVAFCILSVMASSFSNVSHSYWTGNK